MTCIAYSYLQHLRLAGRGWGKCPPRSGTDTIAKPARGAPRHNRQAVRLSRPARPMSLLQAPVPAIT